MSLPNLETFLREHEVDFRVWSHPKAITAQEVAASAHVRGREMAKPVMVKIDGRLAMVVVAASERVHMGLLKDLTGANEVCLATEREFADRFPDCEIGAMPPFGNLFGLEVFVSDTLADDEHIAFNAGNHTEVMQLAYRDFERLAQPQIYYPRPH
ncbi:aminoacyl-tRNA deacylase [Pseudomarimonas arenosa]|uniref:YbaK/EbsC family protein n=1 Tax=Pseudomarimonas arenosa TaxID=2774145 RepID=A0AAW3ZPF5_9GAMM|nr:YbaK/EbsC family protein [Pseudomarimonas arenosa]MBD8527603.1 YbaK/EbsC family protein [Pseudomarimonas arenosa]